MSDANDNSHPWSTDIDHFMAMALASFLMSKTELSDALADCDRTIGVLTRQLSTLEEFCDYLVAHRKLTRWQCDKLREGKYKGFFLDQYKFVDRVEDDDEYPATFTAEDLNTNERVLLRIWPDKAKRDSIGYQIVEPNDL